MLAFQVSDIVFTIINLLILYFFLRKFLFGRINAILDQRKQLIQEQLEAAASGEAKAQALQTECRDQLADARQEADLLLSDARAKAKRAYDDCMEQARADARQVQIEAEKRIAIQRQEMLRSVRQEVAQLAVLAAAQVSGKELDQDSDRAMVEEFLSEAGELT